MDFFAHQEAARRRTGLLVFYFILAVGCIVFAVSGIALLIFGGPAHRAQGLDTGPVSMGVNLQVLGVAAAVTLAIIGLGTLFKILQLGGGGARVAEHLGGRLLTHDTRVFEEKRILNIVEEMALASGVPVPPVYVLDREQGINAFAAGLRPDRAVIGVTRGMLTTLNRSEQQAVIAHEFSHILNGDMRLNIRLMGVLHGILVISLVGRGLLQGAAHSRGGRDRGGGIIVLLLIGLALMVIGFIGVFFGKLIKSAVSRQREFLADASAVQFTRHPEGMTGALAKIGGLRAGSRLRHPRAEEASHMYFGNGLRAAAFSPLATHPPLADRIRRIDPSFDGVFPEIRPEPPPEPPAARQRKGLEDIPMPGRVGPPPVPGIHAPGLGLGALAVVTDQVLETIGRPMEAHLEAARHILASLPEPLREAVHDPQGACAVVYLLLLDDQNELRSRQLDALRARFGDETAERVEALTAFAGGIRPEAHLPLLDMAIPSLKRLSKEAYQAFQGAVDELVAADEQIDRFEYALTRTLKRNLDAHFGLAAKRPAQIYALRGAEAECACLLSVLARTGHPDEQEARAAFDAAVGVLGDPELEIPFLEPAACGLADLDRALERAALVAPRLKRRVVAACLECISHDKQINVAEAELFRAVASALECPVPPWVLST